MKEKIRTGAVSYLNTKPLIYGFEQGMMKDEIELTFDYPSKIAQALLLNTIDIGLLPVAAIPDLPESHIISDYCIGCDGEVASVCLFSEVPLEQIETILLDYQSRTSVELVKILMKKYWKINPLIQKATENFMHEIKGTTAAVVIGDRAFEQRKKSAFCYDLGQAWKDFTGLPFVFAAWVSNKKMPDKFISAFNEANKKGISNLEAVLKNLFCKSFDLESYYTKYVSYELDEQKLKGLSLFLEYLKEAKKEA